VSRVTTEADVHGAFPSSVNEVAPKLARRTARGAPADRVTSDAPRPERRPDEGKQRLVVELSAANAAELQTLTEREGLNKTMIVNRALQLYALLSKVQEDGGEILLKEPHDAVPQRIRFL
jgi:hypothetical protein